MRRYIKPPRITPPEINTLKQIAARKYEWTTREIKAYWLAINLLKVADPDLLRAKRIKILTRNWARGKY